MRKMILIAAALMIEAINVPLPGTCGTWVPQSNGIKWRMCTDTHGARYCEMKTGSKINRITCP